MAENPKKIARLLAHALKASRQKTEYVSKLIIELSERWPTLADTFKPVITTVKPLKRDRPDIAEKEDMRVQERIKLRMSHPAVVMRMRKQKLKKSTYTLDISSLLDKVKSKVSYLISRKSDVPRWKTVQPAVTLETINSRTTQLVASILSAESESSQLKRLDDLLQHLQLHTVGQSHAVREGAIDTLLTLRRRTNDGNVLQSIREVCAALGYIDPPPMQGVRILSIDGGGMRGIAVIRMLEQLEKLTGRKVYELFDYVCGVSTGAIITCCMVPPLAMSMESLCQLYRNFSTRVFQQSMIWGTSKLVWSHAYYDTLRWEKVLTETVGSTRLLETTRYLNAPKICAISTIVNRSYVIPFLFRNYTLPYLMKSDYQGSSNHTMFEAIRASAAAPTIFEEFRIGDMLHQDGGILVNNPTAVAVQESKALWPDEHLSSVISCGTGRTDPVLTLDYDPASQSASTWKGIFDKILESATDTEAVHTTLNSLLPENVYFRLNPPITVSVAIDETNEDNLSQLEDEVDMYYRRNEEKFKIIANKLLVPRSPIKKCGDYIKDRVKILRKV